MIALDWKGDFFGLAPVFSARPFSSSARRRVRRRVFFGGNEKWANEGTTVGIHPSIHPSVGPSVRRLSWKPSESFQTSFSCSNRRGEREEREREQNATSNSLSHENAREMRRTDGRTDAAHCERSGRLETIRDRRRYAYDEYEKGKMFAYLSKFSYGGIYGVVCRFIWGLSNPCVQNVAPLSWDMSPTQWASVGSDKRESNERE